jgi:hypothetical protein
MKGKTTKDFLTMNTKSIFAEAKRSRNEERKIIHEKNKNLLKQKIENIELNAKLEVESIFKKIIKLYKKSARVKNLI